MKSEKRVTSSVKTASTLLDKYSVAATKNGELIQINFTAELPSYCGLDVECQDSSILLKREDAREFAQHLIGLI